jgi:hypothetical protein
MSAVIKYTGCINEISLLNFRHLFEKRKSFIRCWFKGGEEDIQLKDKKIYLRNLADANESSGGRSEIYVWIENLIANCTACYSFIKLRKLMQSNYNFR